MVGNMQVDPSKPCHTSECSGANASIAIVGGILSQCFSGRGKEIGCSKRVLKIGTMGLSVRICVFVSNARLLQTRKSNKKCNAKKGLELFF